jgi:uncharacterized protein YbjT (DUF2867 family)
MKILVTGATGYVGGRLVPALIDGGHDVRCLVRNPKKLSAAPWRDQVEVVVGDLLEPVSLEAALDGVDAACYLVHSMDGSGSDFVERDRRAAVNFRRTAARSGIRRIVYLGGLGRGAALSKHLASRQEVGRILAEGPVPVTELRAAVVIGSGSVSFEMVRYLTEVLPVMVTPTWVRTRCQPISIADVLDILTLSLAELDGDDRVHEIGGPDQLTYEEMMRIYAEVAGLPRRVIIPVPVLTPKLSSHWIGLVTPLPTGVAAPLVDSLRIEVTVADNCYAESVGRPLLGYREAVVDALSRSDTFDIATRWSDASNSPAQASPSDPAWAGGATLIDTRSVVTGTSAENLFWAFSRMGGSVGYYTMNWAWSLRGLLDTVLGGVGLRRGRRHPETLRPGEALDFWRVLDVEPGRSLDLYAEMKLPGEAMLSFDAVPTSGGAELRQTAIFIPRGLLGRLYWWGLLPIHSVIFRRMVREIAATAEARPSQPPLRAATHDDPAANMAP